MANSTKISEYSTTAANNTSIDSIDIDENCPASGINNALRSVLKHQADAFTQGTPIALDQTNNRVGIGTTSPAKSLSINTSSNTDGIDIGGGGTVYTSITSAGTDTTIQATNAFAINTNGANERLRIDSSGNVGIGTTAPTTYGDSNTKLAVVTPTSNANDVNIRFGTNDVKGIIFVNDVSGDGVGFGTTTNDDLQFNTNGTQRLRIFAGGNITVGQYTTSSPGQGNSTVGCSILPSGRLFASSSTYSLGLNRNGDGELTNFSRSGSFKGSININSSSVSYNTTSDHRLKQNVVDMTGAITRLKTLKPKRFDFIADAGNTVDGFLAHEAQTAVPEAVTGTHNEVDDDGNAKYQQIDQAKLVPLLVGALQESIAKIETLETEMTALKARVTALEA